MSDRLQRGRLLKGRGHFHFLRRRGGKPGNRGSAQGQAIGSALAYGGQAVKGLRHHEQTLAGHAEFQQELLFDGAVEHRHPDRVPGGHIGVGVQPSGIAAPGQQSLPHLGVGQGKSNTGRPFRGDEHAHAAVEVRYQHLIGTGPREPLDMALGIGPGHDADAGIELAGGERHVHVGRFLGQGRDQGFRPQQTGGQQYFVVRGVALDKGNTLFRQQPYHFGITFDDHGRHIFGRELPGYDGTDAAVTADDDMRAYQPIRVEKWVDRQEKA